MIFHEVIIKWSVSQVTISAQDVIALIRSWITVATQSMSVTLEKSNEVISLAVPSKVIANSQSDIAAQVPATDSADVPHVRDAGWKYSPANFFKLSCK